MNLHDSGVFQKEDIWVFLNVLGGPNNFLLKKRTCGWPT